MTYEAIIAVLVAIVGWFIAYHFEKRRDHLNKRRDLRVQYLINAYRGLESASNRPLTAPSASETESALADIQLFGSTKQVRLAQQAGQSLADTGSTTYDELLDDLRQDLRKELQLDPVSGSVKYFRIDPPKRSA